MRLRPCFQTKMAFSFVRLRPHNSKISWPSAAHQWLSRLARVTAAMKLDTLPIVLIASPTIVMSVGQSKVLINLERSAPQRNDLTRKLIAISGQKSRKSWSHHREKI